MAIARLTLPLLLAIAGCAPCADSADVQAALVIDEAAAGATRLEVSVSELDGPVHSEKVLLPEPLRSGQTILLRPEQPPTGAQYTIVVDVVALRPDDSVAGKGHQEALVGTLACNRIEIQLVTVTPFDLGLVDLRGADLVGADLAGADLAGADLAGADLAGVDLASCVSTGSDEDGDGRPDDCDICPANPDGTTTVDTDSDGLWDTCDPQRTGPINKPLYFEPFNADLGKWSGTYSISFGGLQVMTTSAGKMAVESVATQSTLVLPVPSSVQVLASMASVTGTATPPEGGVRIYLGDTSGTYHCDVDKHAGSVPTLSVNFPGNVSFSIDLADADVSGSFLLRMHRSNTGIGCWIAQKDGSNPKNLDVGFGGALVTEMQLALGVGILASSGAGSIAGTFSSVFATTYQ